MNDDDVKVFFRKVVERVGHGFHPDTWPEEYVDGKGELVFNFAEAIVIDGELRRVFAAHSFGQCSDPYALAREVLAERKP